MIFEICLILLSIYVLNHYFKPRGNRPPGPRGLPFFGSIPCFYYEDFERTRKKYGNLVMANTGALNHLYITDYNLQTAAFTKDEFLGRLHLEMNELGLISSNGIHWDHSRRFLVRHLRNFGMGKSMMEGLILREVEILVDEFKKLTGKPTALPLSINIASLNMLWQLVASHRYAYNDNSVDDLFQTLILPQDAIGSLRLRIPEIFPILQYILPETILNYISGKTEIYRIRKKIEDLFRPFIHHHLETLDPNNPRDFIDAYLIEMRKKETERLSHISMPDLTRTVMDLFLSGVGATSTMTRWIIIYMAKYPEIQEKIQTDIDQVVPRDILPGLQHKNDLAYLDAAINEIQRLVSFTSFSVRITTEDTKLEGYDIPKGTIVTSVMAFSHKDPTYFKDPDKFDPSRFLDENGKFIPTCEGYQVFGIGKRNCLGEQLARMELFLIAASLLQNFTFGPPDGDTEISLQKRPDKRFANPLKEQKFSIKYRK